MDEKRKTWLWIGAASSILLARELYVFAAHKHDATESEAIWSVADHPPLTFAFGFLAGHLFWQSARTYIEEDKE